MNEIEPDTCQLRTEKNKIIDQSIDFGVLPAPSDLPGWKLHREDIVDANRNSKSDECCEHSMSLSRKYRNKLLVTWRVAANAGIRKDRHAFVLGYSSLLIQRRT